MDREGRTTLATEKHPFKEPLGNELPSEIRLTVEQIASNSERQANGCLLWTKSRSRSGYGRTSVNGKKRQAAHVVWELNNERPVPKGWIVIATCGNGTCVESSHLKLVEKGEHLRTASPLIASKAKPAEARFREKIQKTPDGHQLWLGEIRKTSGKGVFFAGDKTVNACRFAWEQTHKVTLDRSQVLERTCNEPTCVAPEHHRLVDRDHYLKNSLKVSMRLGDAPKRFQRQIRLAGPDDCWPWTGGTDEHGYGMLTVSRGKSVRSHRYAYVEIFRKTIPEGYELKNCCGNPACQNPNHWDPVPRHSTVTMSGQEHRFNAGPRKTAERDAIRKAILERPEASPNVVANEVGVDGRLVQSVWEELVAEGAIAPLTTMVGKDGKTYRRGPRDTAESRRILTEALLRDPQQSNSTLCKACAGSTTLVKKVRKELEVEGRIPVVTATRGRNGRAYGLGTREVANGLQQVLTFEVAIPVSALCIAATESGKPCRNYPRLGHQYCRHHLARRALTAIEQVQVDLAKEALRRLRSLLTAQLAGSLEKDAPGELVISTIFSLVSSVIDDYDRKLLKSPELVATLAAGIDDSDDRSGLVQVWAAQLCETLEPQIRKLLRLTAPSRLAKVQPLPDPFEFPADRVLIAIVEAICSVSHWTEVCGLAYGYRAEVGKTGFSAEVGFCRADEGNAWQRLTSAPELAVKIHYALWGFFTQQVSGSRSGWGSLTLDQLCEVLGYTRHRTGGFKKEQKQSVVDLVRALASIHVRVNLPPIIGSPGGHEIGGVLWTIEAELPSPGSQALPGSVRLCFRPGAWYRHEALRQQTSFVGRFPRSFLGLSTRDKKLVIRLASYLAPLARVKRQKMETVTCRVDTLARRTGLLDNSPQGHGRLREPLESAFGHLVEIDVLADWEYSNDPPTDGKTFLASSIQVYWPL